MIILLVDWFLGEPCVSPWKWEVISLIHDHATIKVTNSVTTEVRTAIWEKKGGG